MVVIREVASAPVILEYLSAMTVTYRTLFWYTSSKVSSCALQWPLKILMQDRNENEVCVSMMSFTLHRRGKCSLNYTHSEPYRSIIVSPQASYIRSRPGWRAKGELSERYGMGSSDNYDSNICSALQTILFVPLRMTVLALWIHRTGKLHFCSAAPILSSCLQKKLPQFECWWNSVELSFHIQLFSAWFTLRYW